MPGQKTVRLRVADTELFHECRDLLTKQLGTRLSDSAVTQAALTALKVQHTHKLITIEDAAAQCKRLSLPNACKCVTEALNLLGDARLLAAGDYLVDGNEHTGQLTLLKDGIPVTPLEEPVNEPPEWAADMARSMKAIN